MSEEYKILIKWYRKYGVSLAGITSLMYINGYTGTPYMETRKIVFKEIQRLS